MMHAFCTRLWAIFSIRVFIMLIAHIRNVRVTKFVVPPSWLVGGSFGIFVFAIFHGTYFPDPLSKKDDFDHRGPNSFF